MVQNQGFVSGLELTQVQALVAVQAPGDGCCRWLGGKAGCDKNKNK